MGSRKQTIDVSTNYVEERVHSIFIVKTEFFLICLDFAEDFLLAHVKKLVDEVEGFMASLRNDITDVFSFVSDGFDENILSEGRGTILDF